ncbi:MAG: 6-carboxytetrahydropterin synthase [Armatimonadetes bacterium]|nr:6-carboxytetrahydropterin synthase [Armatimonadota bacterium]
MVRISCDFWFEASHRLGRDEWSPEENERIFGACARLHGHSYHLRVTLRGPVDPITGMVRNFAEVKRVVHERVIRRVDHQDLNAVVGGLTTAERITVWVAAQLLPEFGDRLYGLELWETRTASVSLGPEELAALQSTARAEG